MNIKQIKYFVSVADHGSLSAAAKEQGVTVQAMSKSMTDLEKDTADSLFTRDHSGIRLTPFGREFYARAEGVVKSFEELESMALEPYVERAEQLSKLRVFICAPSFSMDNAAKKKARLFAESFLGVSTEISLGTGQEGIRLMSEGSLDALLTIGTLNHPDFDCLTVGTVAPCVCVAKNHPLARASSVTLDDLAPYPVLSSPSFDHFNESIFVMYHKAGLPSPVKEKGVLEMTGLFYLSHAYVFMANVPILGEMMPLSTTVPLAADDAIPVPLCLVTNKKEKSEAITGLERLLKSRPF